VKKIRPQQILEQPLRMLGNAGDWFGIFIKALLLASSRVASSTNVSRIRLNLPALNFFSLPGFRTGLGTWSIERNRGGTALNSPIAPVFDHFWEVERHFLEEYRVRWLRRFFWRRPVNL
jgi:hypothetical protein